MFTYLKQLWQSEDLRKRILFTLALLLVYRIVAHIPVPGADPTALRNFLGGRGSGGALGVFAALTGGAIDNFSIVLLGLSPYINASIIMQLCTVIFPKLEALSKEGQAGQQRINRFTRYVTFPLAFLQSYGFLLLLNAGASQLGGQLIDTSFPGIIGPMTIVAAGALFLMWLGEVITEKGIGNGISLIIFTGIVAGMPSVLSNMFVAGAGKQGPFIFFCILTIVLLIAVVLFTEAHRLIPITYANQGAGRGVQGGIPIRLNQAGMIPIIFAISLITFPGIIAQFLQTAPRFRGVVDFIGIYLNANAPSILYILFYFSLVMLFTYFYVSVTFRPEQLAEDIQKRGGFIPGIRPGRQTAEVLKRISFHLNLWGGCVPRFDRDYSTRLYQIFSVELAGSHHLGLGTDYCGGRGAGTHQTS